MSGLLMEPRPCPDFFERDLDACLKRGVSGVSSLWFGCAVAAVFFSPEAGSQNLGDYRLLVLGSSPPRPGKEGSRRFILTELWHG